MGWQRPETPKGQHDLQCLTVAVSLTMNGCRYEPMEQREMWVVVTWDAEDKLDYECVCEDIVSGRTHLVSVSA